MQKPHILEQGMRLSQLVRLSKSGQLGVYEAPALVKRTEVCRDAERRAVDMRGVADAAEVGDERKNLAYRNEACGAQQIFLSAENTVELVHYQLLAENIEPVFYLRQALRDIARKPERGIDIREQANDMNLL